MTSVDHRRGEVHERLERVGEEADRPGHRQAIVFSAIVANAAATESQANA